MQGQRSASPAENDSGCTHSPLAARETGHVQSHLALALPADVERVRPAVLQPSHIAYPEMHNPALPDPDMPSTGLLCTRPLAMSAPDPAEQYAKPVAASRAVASPRGSIRHRVAPAEAQTGLPARAAWPDGGAGLAGEGDAMVTPPTRVRADTLSGLLSGESAHAGSMARHSPLALLSAALADPKLTGSVHGHDGGDPTVTPPLSRQSSRRIFPGRRAPGPGSAEQSRSGSQNALEDDMTNIFAELARFSSRDGSRTGLA